jgi:hypothetical protein
MQTGAFDREIDAPREILEIAVSELTRPGEGRVILGWCPASD